MNEKKKKMKFESESRRTRNSLLQHGLFSPCTSFFLCTFRKIPNHFCKCPVTVSRVFNGKKNLKFEREGRDTEKSQKMRTTKPFHMQILTTKH